MTLEWSNTQLGQAGKWLSGGTPRLDSPEYWGGSVPWASAKDMKRFELWDTEDHITEKGLEKGSRAVDPGNLLIVVRGMILAHTFPVAIAMKRMAFNQDIKAIRCHPHVDSRFLAHWLVGASAKILNKVTDTSHGTKRFDVRHLQRHSLSLPPHDEQQAIARILDAVDVVIEQTRKTIATSEQLKRGLLQTLMRSRRGWKQTTLAEVAEVNRGKFTPRPRNDPKYYGGDYPFVQTGNITRSKGRRLTEFSQTLNELGIAVSRGFPFGTIAVTIAANIADTAILGIPMYFPDSIVGVNVIPPHNARFIELCIRVAKPRLEAQAPQSAQKNLSLKYLRRLRLSVPSPEEQERIASVYEAADEVVQKHEASMKKLEELKRGLMQDLLTGRVRVRLPAARGNGVARSRP